MTFVSALFRDLILIRKLWHVQVFVDNVDFAKELEWILDKVATTMLVWIPNLAAELGAMSCPNTLSTYCTSNYVMIVFILSGNLCACCWPTHLNSVWTVFLGLQIFFGSRCFAIFLVFSKSVCFGSRPTRIDKCSLGPQCQVFVTANFPQICPENGTPILITTTEDLKFFW